MSRTLDGIKPTREGQRLLLAAISDYGTAQEAAKKWGFAPETLSRWLRGHRTPDANSQAWMARNLLIPQDSWYRKPFRG